MESPHPYPPAASFDGGDLDCGNGLLLLIRKHIDPLDPGQLLEIISVEPSVDGDLPAWCRLTGNQLVQPAPRWAQAELPGQQGSVHQVAGAAGDFDRSPG